MVQIVMQILPGTVKQLLQKAGFCVFVSEDTWCAALENT